MAAATLTLAVIFFAARGFFLGLPGVVARLVGLLAGYVIAFSYRRDLATALAAHSDGGLHPVVLQVVSSAVLFFGTLFLVSWVIGSLFKLLSRLLPPLRGLFTREATGSRIAGSALNGAIAACIVLTGLWAYGLTLGKDREPDDLQRVANRFGDTLLAVARGWLDDERPAKPATGTVSDTAANTAPQRSERGTAEIVSSENPERRVFVEQVREVLADKPNPDSDLQSLLQNGQLQDLVNDPAVREQALQYMQENPQQLMEALNNPRFRQLMEQMQAAESSP